VGNPDTVPRPSDAPPLVDLHLHTTASDGVDTVDVLVAKCAAAGLSIIAVTDHDTLGAVPAVETAARAAGLRAIAGIEITAVWQQRDIHVLGYFVDPQAPALLAFLMQQREDRIRRARVIGGRLAELGVPIDIEHVITAAAGRPVTRPAIAAALAEAGHVADRRAAFDQFLGEGRPAFEPRVGAAITDAIQIIHHAGGIASLAHPGLMNIDHLIPDLARDGLDAIEVYHADHDAIDRRRYRALARTLGVGITGGSDYHGDPLHHPDGLGRYVVPAAAFNDVCRRAGRDPFC